MGCGLEEMPLDVLKGFSDSIGEDVYDVLKLEGSVRARNHLGGTAPEQVKKQVARWQKIVDERLAARAKDKSSAA
jgi:argininosuccinate lyase